ncbi:MAG: GLPGLI family protein [Citrobacter freundii]|nr:MAG: GLPGLI family protein [Citrobacter freundii]
MNKRIYLMILVTALSFGAKAQQIFLDKVSIDYAKTVAVWPLMKEIEPEWFEEGKDHMPKETISYFNFTSDGNKSVYKRVKEAEIPKDTWWQPFADQNMIYNDYETGTTISQKPVFEETFLVQDSLSKIKWKLTADTRMIAGFECRKAIGILYDTVAVFAFYTDEIKVSGGPESINGLPGMILGVGIPRLHMTWFATKVQALNAVEPKALAPATKGKKTNKKELLTLLDKALSRGEAWGKKMVLAFVI